MINTLQQGYLYRRKGIVFVLRIIDFLLGLIPIEKREAPLEPAKILIVKPDHLGDCLLSSAALRTLRERYPSAAIDYLAGPWGEAVLKHYPEIRKIWTIRHAQANRSTRGFKKWLQFWRDLVEVVPHIRREKYDVILFLRASGGNFVLTSRFFGAGFLAGHAAGGGGALLDRVAIWKPHVHELEHYTEVLKLLDSALEAKYPYFPASSERLGTLPANYICVHPGAGGEAKKLSLAIWSAILSKTNLPLVICGTTADSLWGQTLRLAPGRPVTDLTSGLSISDLYRVFANADEMHGLDSFPSHLAAVSECPKVYVHFLPASDPEQWRPVGPAVEVVLHASAEAK